MPVRTEKEILVWGSKWQIYPYLHIYITLLVAIFIFFTPKDWGGHGPHPKPLGSITGCHYYEKKCLTLFPGVENT